MSIFQQHGPPRPIQGIGPHSVPDLTLCPTKTEILYGLSVCPRKINVRIGSRTGEGLYNVALPGSQIPEPLPSQGSAIGQSQMFDDGDAPG